MSTPGRPRRTRGVTPRRMVSTRGAASESLRSEVETLRTEISRLASLVMSERHGQANSVLLVDESSMPTGNNERARGPVTLPDGLPKDGVTFHSSVKASSDADGQCSTAFNPGRPALHNEAVDTRNDDWILESSAESNTSDVGRYSSAIDPVHCIEPFDGDPRKWEMFIGSFKALVHDVMPANAVRIAYLRRLLTAQVRDSISGYLYNPNLYHDALTDLKRRYGDRRLIAQYSVKALRSICPMKDESLLELDRFSCELHGIINSLIKCGSETEMLAAGNLYDVVAKLTPRMREKWFETARRLPNSVGLQSLDDWLCEEVLIKRSAVAFDCPNNKQGFRIKDNRANKSFVNVVVAERHVPKCVACKDEHDIVQCDKFNRMPVEERLKLIKKARYCFLCLRHGHSARRCRVQNLCGVGGCSQRHHRLLHGLPFQTTNVVLDDQEQTDRLNVVQVGATRSTNAVLMSVIPLIIHGDNMALKTFALLDSGSEASLITESLARQLGLNQRSTAVCLTTIQSGQAMSTSAVSFKVGSMDGTYQVEVPRAYTVASLNLSHRCLRWSDIREEWPHVSDLPLEDVNYADVQVLLGIDQFYVHRQLEVRSPIDQGQPYAVRGPLGWILAGPIQWKRRDSTLAYRVNRITLEQRHSSDELFNELKESLERFWTTESFGVKLDVPRLRTVEDDRAEQMLERSCTRRAGRYQVGLIWKNDKISLPNNRSQAVGRLAALQRRLVSGSSCWDSYEGEIRRLVDSGVARRLSADELDVPHGKVWYLPHHGVRHPQKPGKLRIVFDGSAMYKGVSLNTSLEKGPMLLNDLNGLLIRFRRYAVPVVADVDHMFHQVLVPEEDQSVLRFVWRTRLYSPIVTYQMSRQVFGIVSAPASCMYALRKCLTDSGHTDVSNGAWRQFYVDNYIDSFTSVENADAFTTKVTATLEGGGFTLSKWASTSREVVASCPQERRAFPWIDLAKDTLPVENTLGLRWNCENDCFYFHSDVVERSVLTKRQLVSAVSKIYDPLGIIAPVVLEAKLLLRDSFEGIDWDDEVTEGQRQRYCSWAAELSWLDNLEIPRWIGLLGDDSVVQLHLFADASERAFGAAAYLKVKQKDGEAKVTLLMAKSRLAPKRTLTIPCLELQAAVVAVRMAAVIKRELCVANISTAYWTDSTIVLQWIMSKRKQQRTFVENRIAEILDSTQVRQWHHVPGRLNPADDLTRGLRPSRLTLDHRWFKGPEFLKLDECCWPLWEQPQSDKTDEPGLENCVAITGTFENPLEKLYQRLSSFKSILRVVAYVIRFCKGPRGVKHGPLVAEELKAAKISCLRAEQATYFGQELRELSQHGEVKGSSRIATLCPYVDGQGLMRVGGRLRKADLPHDTKYPIIVSPKSTLLRRLVWDRHLQLMHAGCERVLADLRSEVWVLSGRRCVQQVLRACLYCRRLTAKATVARMADLPSDRVDFHHPAFSNVGIDFFGPIEVVVKRSKAKRYGLIFTCMTSRACHLEITHSIDVHSTISALRRFIARRGCPRTILSDNGKSFVAAERLLRGEKIDRFISDCHIEWKFNPPTGPHHGGAWERLIAVAKKALMATLHGNSVDDEALLTVVADVEALLNGRPLTYLADDPECFEPLTPFHILIGRQHANIPADVIPEGVTLRRHWKNAQKIVDRFWKKWIREYIPTLQKRDKWTTDRKPLKVGDFVLLVEPEIRRNDWLTGRVVKVHPADDGRFRQVTVRTRNGEFLRPVTRVVLLEEL